MLVAMEDVIYNKVKRSNFPVSDGSIRCTVIKVPHPKREGGPVLLLQNYPHPLSLRGRGPYTSGWGSFVLLKMDCVRVARGGSLSTLHRKKKSLKCWNKVCFDD